MHELALRRLAVQLASQLPDDPQDCRRVMGLMLELVEGFLMAEPEVTPGDHIVLLFPGSPNSAL